MRLDEVHIEDYGVHDLPPLEFGDGVEVVYGPNESGKTLLVDALLFLLTGQNEDDRIGQPPRGYIKVGVEDTMHRLDGDETILDRLTATADINLGPQEFRNTFVVRSADSRLASEDEYYDRATDVVAESLVEDIQRVRRAVRSRGRITRTGMLIDQQDNIKTRTHKGTADDLLDEIQTYIEDAREEGVPALEAELLEKEQQIGQKQAKVERLQAAKRLQKLEELTSQRDELESTLKEVEGLPAEDEVASLSTDVEETVEATDRLEAIKARLDDARTNVRRTVVATSVAAIATLAIGSSVLSSLELSLLGWIAIALAAVVVGAVPGALAVYFWQQRENAQEDLDEVQAAKSNVLRRGRKLGIEADDLTGLATQLAGLEEQIEALQTASRDLHGQLRGALDLDTDTPEETLERATEALEQRASELEAPTDTEFTAGSLEAAETELDDLEAERDRIESQLEEARSDIRSYGADVAELPFTEYGLEPPRTDVGSVDGLEALVDHLSLLIETIEVDADNARAADDALGALKEDEQSRVGELFFGAESRVSETFARITDGRYESVRYDEGENELWVQTANRIDLRPAQLSQSTFDQLYFAVRMAFAQELLDEVHGFLLLDDAFLAADEMRLERQVEIVSELAGDGWQVLYFTAKEYVREQLVDGAEASVHTLERFE